MPNEAVTIYVTKDALRGGGIRMSRAVVIPDGLACEVNECGMALPDRGLLTSEEYRFTLQEAVAAATAFSDARIAALEAEIAAIRAIDLTKPVEG